jgi:CheY-like chemotaxis protein
MRKGLALKRLRSCMAGIAGIVFIDLPQFVVKSYKSIIEQIKFGFLKYCCHCEKIYSHPFKTEFYFIFFFFLLSLRSKKYAAMRTGPIILVEDDKDDYELFKNALKDLNFEHRLIWFENSIDAFDYLTTTQDQPFLIFSDINMHLQNGIEFKLKIDGDKTLRRKSIPFIFYTTTIDRDSVNTAYTEMTIQGFFQKAGDYNEMKKNLKIIVEYWESCQHPDCN